MYEKSIIIRGIKCCHTKLRLFVEEVQLVVESWMSIGHLPESKLRSANYITHDIDTSGTVKLAIYRIK